MNGGAVTSELPCRRALGRAPGGGRWELNPYRGCALGCVYCEARATHVYLGLSAGRDFERRVLAKGGAPPLLLTEMRTRVRPGDVIEIGTVTDPYQPSEAGERLTRRCLLAILEGGEAPVRIYTKSPLALRDLDLFRRLRAGGGVAVGVSVATLDGPLAAKLEPGAPAPGARVELLRRLAEAGIPAGLELMPVLPGLTDRLDALDALVAAAARAGASWVRARPLRLPGAVRPGLLRFLERERPDLLPRYAAHYGRTESPPPAYARRVHGVLEELRVGHGIAAGPEPRGDRREQLSLPFDRSGARRGYPVGSGAVGASRIAV